LDQPIKSQEKFHQEKSYLVSNFGTFVKHHPNPLHAEDPQESWHKLEEPVSAGKLDKDHDRVASEDSDQNENTHEDLLDVHSECIFWFLNIF
jgi:hypothetical protein